ncbi:hybrid sensor histidine kinase/response regulator [Geoalkalibacter sp.]|uniref:hybrid sensor histidine kinase/response regulator n=1 Tax=Geoalkalibacter sp. TaxID=3041440 RepID=UPI00272E41AF|nr:response regulator [Geoalkalibacter sp.]
MTDRKYLDIFVGEAREHLALLRQGVLALESGIAPSEVVPGLLRGAHTLKGAARMLGLGDISRLAHGLEDVLDELEQGGRSCDAELTDVLLFATDGLADLVRAALDGTPAGRDVDELLLALARGVLPAAAPRRAAPEDQGAAARGEDSVRVEVARLDRMIHLLGESAQCAQQMQPLESRLRALETELEAMLAGLRREENYRRLSAILGRARDLRRDLEKDLLAFHLLGDLLLQEAEGLRMVPLAILVEDLRRVVRDLAREQGKQVRFTVSGEDVALDRLLWEALRPALLHLLRNAVDHGIEDPQERRRSGKTPEGEVRLAASYERRGVSIVLSDDGRGIDVAEVRRVALAGGLLAAEDDAELSDEEALYLILRPGFSTRETLTEVSGRGIGMDVARAAVEQVKGHLSLRAQPGAGTEIRLELPLTLARLGGLVIRCEGERYVLPLQYVVGVLHLREEDILLEGGRELVRIDGRGRPLYVLRERLGLAPRMLVRAGRTPAVVLRHRDQQAAWAVSEVVGVQEVVVKSLGSSLRGLPGYAGAAVLGDGLPALILSVPELFAGGRTGALRAELSAARLRRRRGRVLVVDDSITTRTMEKNILEAQGYQVETAIDGEQALEMFAARSFDLVVTDIEMPGIDGFELTRRLRALPQCAELPVIVVTSRASDDDKRRGLDVGAQAYIVKGSFDQGKLVDAVETLIG